jgi:hypothetical protein
LEKAKMVRANILKILLYSFVFIENVLTSGIAAHSQNNHFPRPWKNPWQLRLLGTFLGRIYIGVLE